MARIFTDEESRRSIIDRTRKYFAFQFDLPGASIDNGRVWKATGQHKNWPDTRKRLIALRPEVASLRAEGIAKQHFTSELGQVRAALEAAS